MTICWRYSTSCGLRGCYMPNTTSGPYSGSTRRELANMIRDEIRLYSKEYDAAEETLFRQVKINNLWHHVKRHGSSSAHFYIDLANGECIGFHGLTEDEFNHMERENDQ